MHPKAYLIQIICDPFVAKGQNGKDGANSKATEGKNVLFEWGDWSLPSAQPFWGLGLIVTHLACSQRKRSILWTLQSTVESNSFHSVFVCSMFMISKTNHKYRKGFLIFQSICSFKRSNNFFDVREWDIQLYVSFHWLHQGHSKQDSSTVQSSCIFLFHS